MRSRACTYARGRWPKLRPGGLFSGDDYADFHDTRFVDHKRLWHGAPYYFKKAAEIPKRYSWGVVRATQEFAAEVRAPLHVTWLNDCYFFPAWWLVKPL